MTAEDELAQQKQNQDTAEMKAKYKECREAEGQLRDIEERLGKLLQRCGLRCGYDWLGVAVRFLKKRIKERKKSHHEHCQ